MRTRGRSALLTSSDLSVAGGWVGILSVLDIQLNSAATLEQAKSTDPIDLKDLPQCFSFSALLSPATPGDIPAIVQDGDPLHSTYVVCLALNEECRAMRRGCFYYLPVESRPSSRPTDLVFVDEGWGSRSTKEWDASDWGQRLAMFPAVKKIDPGEQVIPIGARILMFGEAKKVDLTAKSTKSVSAREQSQYPYSSTFDVALKPNVYQYSRPIECLSTVLLTYNSRTSTPFVSLASAAEDEGLCVRFPTPNCLSETFVRRGVSDEDVRRKAESGDRAAELVILGGVSSNQEVILSLLKMWEDGKDRRHPDQQLFGRITFCWQEILNRSEGFDFYDRFSDMEFWPRTEPK